MEKNNKKNWFQLLKNFLLPNNYKLVVLLGLLFYFPVTIHLFGKISIPIFFMLIMSPPVGVVFGIIPAILFYIFSCFFYKFVLFKRSDRSQYIRTIIFLCILTVLSWFNIYYSSGDFLSEGKHFNIVGIFGL